MASPSEKLAESLEVLKDLQHRRGAAIRSRELTRTHRERLVKSGFLQEVIKGWYITSRPDEQAGESTSWYAAFWAFSASHLGSRFDQDWCLSPEQSLALHAGIWTIPRQLLVRAKRPRNNVTKRESSPYVSRIRILRTQMREKALKDFPPAPGLAADKAAYLKQVDELYTSDAYHSLPIEGYRVSAELIERVKAGAWNPDNEEGDQEHRDAMAARVYWQAFQAVKESIEKILDGANPGATIRHSWADSTHFGPSNCQCPIWTSSCTGC